MIFAALVFAATTYQPILGFDPPVFQAGTAQYEFYAQGDLPDGRRAVAFGFTPARRGSVADVEHEVFVALLSRRGTKYELASARRIVTNAVFNMGERGRFETIRAVVNPFRIGKIEYVDVSFLSSISGGIYAANDVIFRVANDGTLVIVAQIDNTQEFSESAKQIRQTTSELGIANGALVIVKHERLASRNDVKQPFRVNCQTTSKAYRPAGHRLDEAVSVPKGKLKQLDRVMMKSVVPCCSGCELPAR